MDVGDLRTLQADREIDTDLCIIGSGPAGLTIAGEFIGSGLRTLIVESGGLTEAPETHALNEVESVGAARVTDQTLVRNRRFGGTSHSWTGRCAPFDEVDFCAREWVPYSGWPLTRASLDPFLARACAYIGIAPSRYDTGLWALSGRSPPKPDVDESRLKHCFWQYSVDAASALDYMRFGPAFLAKSAADARVLLNATVTQLQTNDPGSALETVEATAPNGRRVVIRARAVVLCAGGIENARILLYSNRRAAAGVGNHNDLVGRFLMDHPRCTLGEFKPNAGAALRDRYGLFRVGGKGGHFFVQGVGLSSQLQERLQLLNCAAWLTEHRAPDDPWEAAKRLASGRARLIGRDAWCVVSQPGLVMRGLHDRVVRGRGLPHKLQRLVLDCIVEQRPDRDSRITLSERTDRLGLNLARLDWRIGEQERTTAQQLGALVCEEFARIGLAVPTLESEQRFIDASHPTGGTRMAADPKRGVVDANCAVHGVAGLFIAGSSVFPTSGHANPTLMIVALAIRLADHLKQQVFRADAPDQPGLSAISTS